MSDPSSRNLSNSFLAVRLLALHEFPAGAALGAGPYLVVQRGLDPADPAMEPGDFLLTREGTWLPVQAYLRLSPEDRWDLACFPSAADVMALLQALPPRARVTAAPVSGDVAPEAATPPPLEAFDAAVLRAIRRISDAPQDPSDP